MMHSILSIIIFVQLSYIIFAQPKDKSTCADPKPGRSVDAEGNPIDIMEVVCEEPIQSFKCDQHEHDICSGTVVTITNPMKDFYIKAEDDNIAIGTTFNVVFNTRVAPDEPITSIEGVLAGGDESLCDSTVIITNNQIDTTLEIKKLEYNGDWSADNLKVILKDGPGSGGIKLLEPPVCGDNGYACTKKGPPENPEIMEPNCQIITESVAETRTVYDCMELMNLKQSVSTAAVPVEVAPAARSNLESEIEHELDHASDTDDNEHEKKITLSFSEGFMINLWGMISLFVLLNIALFVCYKKQINSQSTQHQREFV